MNEAVDLTVGQLPVADVLQVGPGVLAHVHLLRGGGGGGGGGDGTLVQLHLPPPPPVALGGPPRRHAA